MMNSNILISFLHAKRGFNEKGKTFGFSISWTHLYKLGVSASNESLMSY